MDDTMTIDAALELFARGDLFTQLWIEPGGTVGIVSVDTGHNFTSGDSIPWTYDGGLEGVAGDYHTRVFEPFESWDDARHVDYNLPEARELLSARHTIVLAYGLANDMDLEYDEEDGTYITPDGERVDDDIVGWYAEIYDLGIREGN